MEVTTINAPTEDMETLMFDHISGDLYIVSKNHYIPRANIYKFTPPNFDDGGVINADLVGKEG